MPLSTEERLEIVFLRLHPLGPKLSFNAITEYTKGSKETVVKCVKRYEEFQSVEDKKGEAENKKQKKRKTL